MLEQSPRPHQIVYILESGESWIDFQLDFLIQSRPDWALETAVRIKDGSSQLVLDVSELTSAESIDAKSPYSPQLGEIRLKAILEAYEKASDALFGASQILLAPSQVFFDPSSGQVRLMVLPVTRRGESDSLEDLVRSIAKAYHFKKPTLDRHLAMVQDLKPAKTKQYLNSDPVSTAAKPAGTDLSNSGHPASGKAGQKFRLARIFLIAAHLVLLIFWILVWAIPGDARSWFSSFELPALLKPWRYHLLGLYASILLLTDMAMAGIWGQGIRLAAHCWNAVRSRWTPRKARSSPGQVDEARASDQTELIQVQQSAYRLGLLSIGMPGILEETESLRAYILVDEFLVGRDDALCDLPLPASSVGRRHARITRREGSFFITDLGSKNGTSLDGRRLNKLEDYLLPDRCRIEFADQAFYFTAD